MKGLKYQVRWWLSEHGSINCGLFDTEEAAAIVRAELAAETAKHPTTPLGLWTALQVVLARLKQRWPMWSPPRVTPKYVRQRADGLYFARVRVCGRVIELPGPYATPEAAHEAMVARLRWLGLPKLQLEQVRRRLQVIKSARKLARPPAGDCRPPVRPPRATTAPRSALSSATGSAYRGSSSRPASTATRSCGCSIDKLAAQQLGELRAAG